MSGTLWNRLSCLLTGHDYTVRHDSGKIFLRCDGCGHRSEGWSLGPSREQHHYVQDRARGIRLDASSESHRAAAR